MIQSKKDYELYLKADALSCNRNEKLSVIQRSLRAFLGGDEVWEFQRLLREVEYYSNCRQNIIDNIKYALTLKRLHRLSLILGFYIHANNFGPGLSISHPGTIVINSAARIGANCRIHPCTVIGTQAGFSDKAAHIGNNVYIGPGVKIFGPIEIADDIAIGANSVVNKSFTEPGITIAGVPARKISNKGSKGLVIKGTDLIKYIK